MNTMQKNNGYKKEDALTAIVFLVDSDMPLKYRNIIEKRGGKNSFEKFVTSKWKVDHINYYTGLTKQFVEQKKIAQ